MRQHLFGDVTSYILDGLIARPTFSQFGDQCVPIVVPSALYAGVRANLRPNGLKRSARFGGVRGLGLPEREYEPRVVQLSEFGFVPLGMAHQCFERDAVQWNCPVSSSLSFHLPDDQIGFVQMDTAPL